MKYRLLSFASISIGLLLALFFVEGEARNPKLTQFFPLITAFILKGLAILSVVLLLSGLCIAANRLLRVQKFGACIRYFFLCSLVIYIITQSMAYLLSKLTFLPNNQVPDISRIQSSLSIFGLSADTWNQIPRIHGFFPWLFALVQLSTEYYLIAIVFICFLAFVMRYDMEVAEPLYNLTDSISRLCFRLLQNLFTLLSIYLIAYTFYTVWQIRSNALLEFYMGFIARLTLITLALFILAPLFLRFVYKDKQAFQFLWQSFLSIFTSFLTGSPMLSIATLAVEQKNRLDLKRNTTGLLNPLNLLFLRPGIAITLAYSFITYYSSNTRWQLNFFPELLWVVIVPIAFAMLIGLFSIPNYFMVLPFYFVLFGMRTTDTFVIMTPILLLGQNFANCIDLLSWNVLNYIYDKFYSEGIE